MMVVRHYTALLLSTISLITAPISCQAFYSSGLQYQPSKTAIHNNIDLSAFCAEADIQQINQIPQSDSTSSSARGWMEHIEQRDGSKYGVGSYTVLRCDATLQPEMNCEWKIWGEKFHMDRLSSSFQTLTTNLFGATESAGSFYGGGITSMSGMGSSVHTESMFTDSIEETRHVMTMLLEQATKSICANSCNLQHEGSLTHTLMLTILWTPSSSQQSTPLVRGHAVFSTIAPEPTTSNSIDNESHLSLPTPITACVAIPNQLTPESLSILPRRHGMNLNLQRQVGSSASAKVSSWCRIRRPLEDPNRYKPPVVGEVILVRKPETERGTNIMTYSNENFIDTLELLEGLISNLFVVYKDGTVRTAPVGLVLPGYARHLIIQELNERGIKVDSSNPPTIQDMRDGLWSEVFVTSAIRLVVPVERIIMPATGANVNPMILWEAPNDEYRATRMIQSAMYQRGCSQATVKNVVSYI
mmetsp:Transcript_26557/g.45200  ORF Transcript_26557/g.45200 Transcript_26557/m.45200 type:complete len:472 (+) Transcript_26557:148-1563(+)